MLWEILIQFIFRLSLGLTVTMGLTSPKDVNSGFFRVHLWVLLGLGTFGSLVAYSRQREFEQASIILGTAIAFAVLSYFGSVFWLYDKVQIGRATLIILSVLALILLFLAHPSKKLDGFVDWGWLALDIGTGSFLLGTTFAAMLLGHWYLNSPGMKLDPLRWLLVLMAMSILARSLLVGVGFMFHFQQGFFVRGFYWAGVVMRWLAGLIGLGGMTWMTWQTLKIPNTQSATGILYVALVFAFLGELASAILGLYSPIPL